MPATQSDGTARHGTTQHGMPATNEERPYRGSYLWPNSAAVMVRKVALVILSMLYFHSLMNVIKFDTCRSFAMGLSGETSVGHLSP